MKALMFDAPWVMPSPNIPTIDTAVVYPGMVYVEGTTLSEGRGTTRPFEIVGAPAADAYELAATLNGLSLPGVYFRPHSFQPTFQKHAGRLCHGCGELGSVDADLEGLVLPPCQVRPELHRVQREPAEGGNLHGDYQVGNHG